LQSTPLSSLRIESVFIVDTDRSWVALALSHTHTLSLPHTHTHSLTHMTACMNAYRERERETYTQRETYTHTRTWAHEHGQMVRHIWTHIDTYRHIWHIWTHMTHIDTYDTYRHIWQTWTRPETKHASNSTT
jgi:hypothetical protein